MFFYKYGMIGDAMEKYLRKSELRVIRTSDISADLPNLKEINESKSVAIGKWLSDWIKNDLRTGKISEDSLLPTKAEFAYMLGVSVGTIQNALRYLEDTGLVESKQCIGTIIRNKKYSPIRKLTSKREIAVENIKSFIKNSGIKLGQSLPSGRIISSQVGCSSNTARLALENLCTSGILTHNFKKSKDSGFVLKSLDFEINDIGSGATLVDKITSDLKKYISENHKTGDKLPAHGELSKKLNVSIKTLHDALIILGNEGILLPKRGRYGTTIIRMPNEMAVEQKRETSIFAPAQQAAFYHYEKVQNSIKKMIASEYEIGSKLPSIMELSAKMDISPNTIRKAVHNLAEEGYIAFMRGRYGGTFVIDIPEIEQTFKWLAVNPKYAKVEN